MSLAGELRKLLGEEELIADFGYRIAESGFSLLLLNRNPKG